MPLAQAISPHGVSRTPPQRRALTSSERQFVSLGCDVSIETNNRILPGILFYPALLLPQQNHKSKISVVLRKLLNPASTSLSLRMLTHTIVSVSIFRRLRLPSVTGMTTISYRRRGTLGNKNKTPTSFCASH